MTYTDAFSDDVGVQNDNKYVIRFWSYVATNRNVQRGNHNFLTSGHSFMECNQNFNIAQKAKKKT